MFRSPTLSFYFARRFAKTALIIFIVVFVLMAFIDYLELARRAARREGFDAFLYLLVSLARVPNVIERALPFTILFASMASFVMANRQLELVVARASGVSAWQFLLPAGLVAVLIGIFATTVFNPISTELKERSILLGNQLAQERVRIESAKLAEKKAPEPAPPPTTEIVASADNSDWPVWMRQTGREGSSIIGARQSLNRGLSLVDASAFVFKPDGSLARRIDASTADFEDGDWVFRNATVLQAGSRPTPVPEVRLPTDLNANQVSQRLADPETVSFWSLPELVEISKKSAVPSDAYEMQFQSLLAQPLLFLAMVFVAATVSLRFSRSRDLGQVILTGVAVGFVLYVITELARGLGRSGVVSPMIAAWTPAIVAILLSVTVLLHREDG
ncbi:LptF/LptG family permease [Kaistia granuli]|uniref:LptF/LptG family permease n=1 Tax=Kaistia granuli TaxID=363259 RepID=UPI00037F267B|nr:LptF/LptG family permease [Kaistia granuli]